MYYNFKNTLNTTQLLRRGWTRAMIKESPLKPSLYKLNPYYRSGSPMKLYSSNWVDRVEHSEWFINRLALANKRRESCKKGLGTKKIIKVLSALKRDLSNNGAMSKTLEMHLKQTLSSDTLLGQISNINNEA